MDDMEEMNDRIRKVINTGIRKALDQLRSMQIEYMNDTHEELVAPIFRDKHIQN